MRRGEWPDDTVMALCLADSLLANGVCRLDGPLLALGRRVILTFGLDPLL